MVVPVITKNAFWHLNGSDDINVVYWKKKIYYFCY